jgi:four helix bundle protein
MRERPYQKLIVWKEAHMLCVWIYRITKDFPSDERFGLISQMRRSSSSIPTNIAEGNAKRSFKDKRRFFEISTASLEEIHYQCILALDLGFIPKETFEKADDHIQRIGYLIEKLRSSLF